MGALTDGCCHETQSRQKDTNQISPIKKVPPTSSTLKKLKTYASTNISSIKSLKEIPMPIDVQRKSLSDGYKSIDNEMDQIEDKKYLSLDDFVIKGQLGAGNFGCVYLVHLKNDEKQQKPINYALKKISKSNFINKKIEQGTKLEKLVMANLHNPFLTALKFAFADQQYVYLVMEYASGGSVETLLPIKQQNKKNLRIRKFKELGEKGIKFIVGSAILGLEHLHQNQIIYRDLKPQNVIIFDDGYVKLADFGLTKILMNNQQTKTEAGTVLYFAPEIVLKQGYSKLADFWQLGIFIYQLATSRSPFRKDEILTRSKFKDVILQFEKQNNWKQDNLSDQLKDIVRRLLKFDPKERLGAHGFEELKQHPFFIDLDWGKLCKKELDSPLLPIIMEVPLKIKEVKSSPTKLYASQRPKRSDEEWSYDYRSLN